MITKGYDENKDMAKNMVFAHQVDTAQRLALVEWRDAKAKELIGLCAGRERANALWERAKDEQRGAGVWATLWKFREMLGSAALADRGELYAVDIALPRVGGVFETKTTEVSDGR